MTQHFIIKLKMMAMIMNCDKNRINKVLKAKFNFCEYKVFSYDKIFFQNLKVNNIQNHF